MSVTLSEEQFQQLLSRIGTSPRHGSMTTCKATYNGLKDRETVEAFLTAVNVFKRLEHITDEDALTSLPVILKDDAAKWWQGAKCSVTRWVDFEDALRATFAPKKPEYVIYMEIYGEKQTLDIPTDTFVTTKRLLFAELPRHEQLTEKQQLDIVYGLLNLHIRDKVPRDGITTFDDLLHQALGVEALVKEKNIAQQDSIGNTTSTAPNPRSTNNKKPRCNRGVGVRN